MQPQDPSYCTPPSSDIEPDQRLPPSPPQSPKPRSRSNVDRLLTFLRLRKAGRPVAYPEDGEWKHFKLAPAQFGEFRRRLDTEERLWGWFEDKSRYDYDPLHGEFVLRMPSVVHELFSESVKDAISKGITEFAERLEADHHEETAESLRQIFQGGSATVHMHTAESKHSSQSSQASARGVAVQRSPDGSFYHPAGARPALVLEVSYSQQPNAIPRIAESYILDSSHDIRCVLGLDITYASGKRKDKTATVSVWRAALEKDDQQGDDVGVCRCDVDAVTFRDGDGAACAGGLELFVGDLLPYDIVNALPEAIRSKRLIIPFAQLASGLANAEAVPKAQSKPRPFKIRKRKRTPSEELSDHREEAVIKQEEAELKKEQVADEEWRSSRRTNTSADQIEVVERRRSKRNKSGRSVGEGS